MKKSIFFILSLIVAIVSCKDDEITTDPSCRLSYSIDTIKFDTILNGMITPYQTLKVYNKSREKINIASVRYSSSTNFFKININGRNLDAISNYEILDGDSLYLFVQTAGDKDRPELPFSLLDSISFSYNGNVDYIYLSAFSETAVVLDHLVVSSDTTLSSTNPYFVKDSLIVKEGAVLTVDPGVRLYFDNGAGLYVDGSLKCNGDVENPIEMRYFRSDKYYTDIKYYLVPGNWNGVYLTEKSGDCQLLSTNIVGAIRGLYVDSTANERKVVIGNSQIFNARQGVLTAVNANLYAYNSVFANGGYYNVNLKGGNYLFNHCTIASYMAHGTSGKKPALYLDKMDSIRVEINNSIVCGNNYKKENRDTIYTELDNTVKNLTDSIDGNTFRLRILSSVIAHDSLSGDNYIDVVWAKKMPYELVNYQYDFKPDSLSMVRTVGSDAVLKLYPECQTDIMGKSRVDDHFPDAGAYEY